MNKYRVAIVGGRDFTDYRMLEHYVTNSLRDKTITHEIVIVCGLAKGADLLGKQYALERGYAVEEYPANWNDLSVEPCAIKKGRYGYYNALAGHNRNQTMREVSDAVIAFWDGQSKGTKEMIDSSRKMGVPTKVFEY